MYGRELAACQLNIKPELNLTWSLQLCMMFYGVGFFISVINEVETVTVLILYKTGGMKCKMGGLRGKNQDYYAFIWVVHLDVQSTENPTHCWIMKLQWLMNDDSRTTYTLVAAMVACWYG